MLGFSLEKAAHNCGNICWLAALPRPRKLSVAGAALSAPALPAWPTCPVPDPEVPQAASGAPAPHPVRTPSTYRRDILRRYVDTLLAMRRRSLFVHRLQVTVGLS